MKRLVVQSILFFYALTIYCQDTFNRRTRLNFPASVLTSIVPSDSCYYSSGIIADSVFPYNTGNIFVKLNLYGEPLFAKTIRNPQKTYETWFDNLILLEDGTFALQGYSVDSTIKTIFIRFNHSGDTIFTKEFLNPFNPSFDFIQPRGGVGSTSDGGFVLVNAIRTSNLPNVDNYVIKIDSTGNVQWDKIFSNSMWDRPQSVLVAPNDKIIIGSVRTNENIVNENYSYKCHLFKIDNFGELEWEYLTPDSIGLRDAANNMILLEDGSLIVASGVGTEIDKPSVNDVHFDKQIFKLNPNQEIEWELTFPDKELTSWSRTSNLINLSDGTGYILTGMEYTKIGFPPVLFTVKGWVGKISPEGDSIWTRRYAYLTDRPNAHEIFDAKETPDGGIILCGESRDYSDDAEFPQQAWLLKLDEYGCLIPGCQVVGDAEEKPEDVFELAIFPNPTSDYLNFQLRNIPPQINGQFRIVDIQSRLVRSFDVRNTDDTYIVSVWDWPGGIYFLQLLKDGIVVASERFVVGR